MKYYFPDWMFSYGKQSHCYSEENLDLSDQDKKGAALAYPMAQAEVSRITNMQRGFLSTLQSVQAPSQNKFELQMLQLPPQ